MRALVPAAALLLAAAVAHAQPASSPVSPPASAAPAAPAGNTADAQPAVVAPASPQASVRAPTGRTSAADSETPPLHRDAIIDRAHAMVEVGLGGMSLPYKQLCIPTQNRCATSDFTLLGSLRYMLRPSPRFSFGAGVALGFRPISDDADIVTPNGTIQRVHSRNYLILSGQGRYFFARRDGFEAWVGASGGLIVVSDRYELEDKGTAIINPRSTTLATQGPMVGFAAGADWALSTAWTVGGWTHQMLWFLPDKAACGATSDCATVSGLSYSLEIGLAFTYRTRL